jgi:glutamate synthase (NADPH/NADH) small chain
LTLAPAPVHFSDWDWPWVMRMSSGAELADLGGGRLSAEDYSRNFADLHPPLTPHEALVEADRCYFCFDAPCMNACPTHIDVPLFIRQIQAGNPEGAGKTILDANIMGGMCARVCPVETLCEEACVRNLAEEKPVKIGMLQRFATDAVMARGDHPYRRAAPTGKRVAVVGAGPAGLACAHRLATYGHDVAIFDAREKPGGLNEFGIAAYKAVDDFAQREVEFVLAVGGIAIETGKALGRDFSLADLREDFDAVFLGMGLAGVNALNAEGERAKGAVDAVDWIAELRQAKDLAAMPVGRQVVVIGGGMTAIDAAVQSKLLGAEEVTIAYRRGQAEMKASLWEQELAKVKGVRILHFARPLRIVAGVDGRVAAVELARTQVADGRLLDTGEVTTVPADMVFKAIGQTFVPTPLDGSGADIRLENGRIAVDAERRTSMPGVWAGGDCVAGGEDLTVAATQDGKLAAESIHRALCAGLE